MVTRTLQVFLRYFHHRLHWDVILRVSDVAASTFCFYPSCQRTPYHYGQRKYWLIPQFHQMATPLLAYCAEIKKTRSM